MNSEKTQGTVFDQRICFIQIPLFPYDPWGARFAFEVVENPAPGISRAMIGPMLLGDNLERSGIQCLAVTKDGNFAAAVWVSQPKLYNPELFWKKVEDDLVTARLKPISPEKLNHCLDEVDLTRFRRHISASSAKLRKYLRAQQV